jgi:hypothetical protein
VISCNYSRCAKLGWLLTFAPPDDFRPTSGDGETREFLFNKRVILHLFCKTCGIESFAHGTRPDGTKVVAINARCLEGVDPDTLNIKKFDGRPI